MPNIAHMITGIILEMRCSSNKLNPRELVQMTKWSFMFYALLTLYAVTSKCFNTESEDVEVGQFLRSNKGCFYQVHVYSKLTVSGRVIIFRQIKVVNVSYSFEN